MKNAFLLIIIASMLAACSSAPNKDNWSTEIPQRSYFTDYYAQDPANQEMISQHEYLTWIHRFYFGWELYSRGWLQATDELAASLKTPEDKQSGREKMLGIGALISPEWAKNRNHRVINLRHINIWGNAINAAMVRKEQLTVLNLIRKDIDQLLARTMLPKDITSSRYHEEKPFEISDKNF